MPKVDREVLLVLEQCKIEGNMLFLPDYQLDRDIYLAVNKILVNCEGKWNRKHKAHIFNKSPVEYIENIILTGDYTNYKKEFQYFPTYPDVTKILCERINLNKNDAVLEPSAGEGYIAKEVAKIAKKVYVCEKNIDFHNKLNDFELLTNDTFELLFSHFILKDINKVIMNPPFRNQEDIDHVSYIFSIMPSDTQLISVMSKSWQWRDNSKSETFRNLVNKYGYYSDLPENSFKSSGTSIDTCFVYMSN